MAAKPKLPRGIEGTHDLTHQDSAFLECRDIAHAWRRVTDSPITIKGVIVAFERHFICESCTSTAVDTISIPSFRQLKKRKIDYPDGYVEKGQGRIPKTEARRELYLRQFKVVES